MSSPSPPNFYDILRQKVADLTQPEVEEAPPQFTPLQNRFFERALSFYESLCNVTDEIRKAVEATEFPEQHKAIHGCPFCPARSTIRTVAGAKIPYWHFGNYRKHLTRSHPEKLIFRQSVLDGDAELELGQGESLSVASVVTLASDGNAIDETAKEIAVEKDEEYNEDEIAYDEGEIDYVMEEPDQLIEEMQLTSHDVTVFKVFKDGFSINGDPIIKFNKNVVLEGTLKVVRMELGRQVIKTLTNTFREKKTNFLSNLKGLSRSFFFV